jgi:folate receptor
MKISLVTASLVLSAFSGVQAYEDICSPFNEIYADGTELCEVMWNGAFEVVDDEDKGYSFWFFDSDNNPNDEVSRTLFGESTTVDECHLNFYHKEIPSPEGEGMSECHPWKDNSCCHNDTVGSVDTINESYGEGFEWDRCGPMSQACERFFVMEACFYECEPNAGLYRKYNDSQKGVDLDFNEWQLEKMPIKKTFCNAWYTACYNDYFCGKGNFWDCEAHYKTNLKKEQEAAANAQDENKGLTIGLSVAGVIAFLGLFASFFLVYREKRGVPVFAPEAGGVDNAVSS